MSMPAGEPQLVVEHLIALDRVCLTLRHELSSDRAVILQGHC